MLNNLTSGSSGAGGGVGGAQKIPTDNPSSEQNYSKQPKKATSSALLNCTFFLMGTAFILAMLIIPIYLTVNLWSSDATGAQDPCLATPALILFVILLVPSFASSNLWIGYAYFVSSVPRRSSHRE